MSYDIPSRDGPPSDGTSTLAGTSPAFATAVLSAPATNTEYIHEDIRHLSSSPSRRPDRYNNKVSWWADAIPQLEIHLEQCNIA